MYVKTITPDEATGEVAELYNAEIAAMGTVMQATSCWRVRPDMLLPIERLLHQMRDGFSLGSAQLPPDHLHRGEAVPSSCCSRVYFRSLSGMLGRDQALAIHRDYRKAGLTEQQVEMLAYAEQITRDASKITEADIARLRAVGFTDLNIADIALAAAYRNFASRYFDAIGTTAEGELPRRGPRRARPAGRGRK